MTDYPREHIELARKVIASGLIVTQLMPLRPGPRDRGWPDSYNIQFWTPEGTLWAEGSGESAEMIGWHIENWEKHRD